MCDTSGSVLIRATWTKPDQVSDQRTDVIDPTVTFQFTNCKEYGESLNGRLTLAVSGSLCDPTAVSLAFEDFSFSDDMGFTITSRAFDNYVEAASRSGSLKSITLNGALTAACLDGWVTLATLIPVQINDGSECPFQGSVRISGADDVQVEVNFNADGSVDIGDQPFASCQDPSLPDTCQ